MEKSDIGLMRLSNLRVNGNTPGSAAALLRHLGAVQAQDYPMACWALGIRLPGFTLQDVENAVKKAAVVRTHVLRPTWHFVPATDARWMVALSAKRIRTALSIRDREWGIDRQLIAKTNALLASALSGGRSLSRDGIALLLQERGICTDENRLYHYLMHAEQDLVVCSGMYDQAKPTYRLMDECVPQGSLLTGEEAEAELAVRYFTSHGPAQAEDFSWWSGVSLAAARRALASGSNRLESLSMDGKIYWLGKQSVAQNNVAGVHLLPAFDEFLVGYRDRSAVVTGEIGVKAISKNGIFRPVVVVNGRVAGLWSRNVKKGKMILSITMFTSCNATIEAEIREAAVSYGKFLEMETVVQM